MFIRTLSSAVAVASLFVAAPAFAGNRDGFEPERVAQATKHDCARCAAMMRDQGSAGEVGDTTPEPTRERWSTRVVEEDPFNRSMDAGG